MNVPITKLAAALSVATILSACGGSGGSSPALEINGTAATGTALAGSAVQAKCAAGTSSATADGNGRYTLTITDGQLPCMIQVVGDANGTRVTLHSLVEAGTGADGKTSATANVTPLTEMIVAHVAAALPASLFENFGSGKAITTEQLAAATSAVLSVLREVTGIDGSGLDPFKGPLVAASAENPTGGNEHDKLLDKLGATVPTGSLAVVASQIANAAASSGTTDRQGLTSIFAAAHDGAMPGCWVAKNGAHRAIDYFGGTAVRHIDFKALKFSLAEGQPALDIQPLDPAKPCEFTAVGTANGEKVEHQVVIGFAGAGAYRVTGAAGGASSVGHLFPVQALSQTQVQGEWRLVRSGDSGGRLINTLSRAQVQGETVETCDHDTAQDATCSAPMTFSLATRSDGGLNLVERIGGREQVSAQVYGFLSANQQLILYGTSNAAGAPANSGAVRTQFVAVRARTLDIPAVGEVSKYWDVNLTIANGIARSTLTPNAVTITESDPSMSVVRRVRSSDGRADRMRYNFPVDGLRLREAGILDGTPFAAALQLPLPIGVTLSINGDTTGDHFYVISVVRP